MVILYSCVTLLGQECLGASSCSFLELANLPQCSAFNRLAKCLQCEQKQSQELCGMTVWLVGDLPGGIPPPSPVICLLGGCAAGGGGGGGAGWFLRV